MKTHFENWTNLLGKPDCYVFALTSKAAEVVSLDGGKGKVNVMRLYSCFALYYYDIANYKMIN